MFVLLKIALRTIRLSRMKQHFGLFAKGNNNEREMQIQALNKYATANTNWFERDVTAFRGILPEVCK